MLPPHDRLAGIQIASKSQRLCSEPLDAGFRDLKAVAKFLVGGSRAFGSRRVFEI